MLRNSFLLFPCSTHIRPYYPSLLVQLEPYGKVYEARVLSAYVVECRVSIVEFLIRESMPQGNGGMDPDDSPLRVPYSSP